MSDSLRLRNFDASHLVEPTPHPVGAVLTAGRKLARGGVGGKALFWVGLPTTEAVSKQGRHGKYSDQVRPLHPSYRAFNELALCNRCRQGLSGKLDDCLCRDQEFSDQRMVIDAVLVHAKAEEFRENRFYANTHPKGAPGASPPHQGPWCHGGGVRAQRWMGEGPEYQDISCPGNACRFRQGDRPPCAFRLRLLFMPVWSGPLAGLPCDLFRFASNGREAKSTFEGVLEEARLIVRGVFGDPNMEISNWQGLPFRILHGFKTSKAKASRYTNIKFAPGDIRGWVREQAREIRELKAGPQPLTLLAEVNQTAEAHGDASEPITIGPVDRPALVAKPNADPEPVIDAEALVKACGGSVEADAEPALAIGKAGAKRLLRLCGKADVEWEEAAVQACGVAVAERVGSLPEKLTPDEANAIRDWLAERGESKEGSNA
jgi:hypothetical protein